jgi:hypothetical protein
MDRSFRIGTGGLSTVPDESVAPVLVGERGPAGRSSGTAQPTPADDRGEPAGSHRRLDLGRWQDQ